MLVLTNQQIFTFWCSIIYRELDEAAAIRTIQKAIKSGVNYIDTAPWYGQGKSEEIMGRALQGVPREAYYIATKIGRYEKELSKQINYSADKTRESVDRSLELLQLKQIDVIQVSVMIVKSDAIRVWCKHAQCKWSDCNGKTRFVHFIFIFVYILLFAK